MTTCYYCANEGTDEAPLVWFTKDDGTRILVHDDTPCEDATDDRGNLVYPDDDPDTTIPVCGHVMCAYGYDPCPPLPEGHGKCHKCLQARPLDRLGDDLSENDRDGNPLKRCRFGGCLVKHIEAHRVGRDDTRQDEDEDERLADLVPRDGPGLRFEEVQALWGVATRAARDIIKRLTAADLLVSEDLPRRGGGKAPKAYWRAS